MKFKYLDKIKFQTEQTIREVLESFSETALYTEGGGFGVIVDKQGICCGVITDGDIRRQIVKGICLDTPIGKIMNTEFIFSNPGDSPHRILRLFDRRAKSIPVIDDTGKLIDLIQISDFDVMSRIEKKIIRSRVPVRISFSGGGTDMSYYFDHKPSAVLSSTINKYCYASVLVRPDNKVCIISKDLNKSYEVDSLKDLEYGDSLDLIKACVKIMQPEFGFDLETLSQFEPGTGLGGSSAVSVAVIGALNHFRNENYLDKYHIADLAYQVERIELGISGGWQDQYAITFGGINWIEFRQNEIMVYPLRVSKDILLELHYNLLLFRFGKNRLSGEIARDQKQKYYSKESAIEKKYEQMTKIAGEMKEALLRGHLKRFADLLDEGWQLKKSFSRKISNEYIEKLYTIARNEGALGGKVLGAGSEGYLLIYASPLYQKAIIDSLQSLGAKLENFDFTEDGLQTWATKR